MKICSFGETLIDFTPVGVSENGNIIFERNPGGAPANLAAAAVKHGVQACFVGEVGDDIFGQFLQEKAAQSRRRYGIHGCQFPL